MVTYPLPNALKPNPKQPVVDPKDSHGYPTVGNRIQHVQSQGLARPQSNTGEHMSVTHRCATAFWLSLPVPSQNRRDVLSYDLKSISLTLLFEEWREQCTLVNFMYGWWWWWWWLEGQRLVVF